MQRATAALVSLPDDECIAHINTVGVARLVEAPAIGLKATAATFFGTERLLAAILTCPVRLVLACAAVSFALPILAAETSRRVQSPVPVTSWRLCKTEAELFRDQDSARIDVALICEPGLEKGDDNTFYLPLGESLLVGLTATSRKEITGEWTGDADLPVQLVSLSAGDTKKIVSFKITVHQIAAKTNAILGIWFLSSLTNCSSGRPGCKLYGYALDKPKPMPQVCTNFVERVGSFLEAKKNYQVCVEGIQKLVVLR